MLIKYYIRKINTKIHFKIGTYLRMSWRFRQKHDTRKKFNKTIYFTVLREHILTVLS